MAAPVRRPTVTDVLRNRTEENEMTLTRQNVLAIGVGAAALAALALAGANFLGGEEENGGVGPYVVTLAASVAVAVALFGWAIPRVERPSRAGIVAGAFALLSLPVYWVGLPYVLGPAAIALGLLGRARSESTGTATTAVALGALATVAAVAAVVFDQVL
jgi:hypothetical protein